MARRGIWWTQCAIDRRHAYGGTYVQPFDFCLSQLLLKTLAMDKTVPPAMLSPAALTIAALLISQPASCAAGACSGGMAADEFGLSAAGYAEDHLNYLCTNWTRPTPLPCRPAVRDWQPRWGGGVTAHGVLQPQRFVVFAWYPPVPAGTLCRLRWMQLEASVGCACVEPILGWHPQTTKRTWRRGLTW